MRAGWGSVLAVALFFIAQECQSKPMSRNENPELTEPYQEPDQYESDGEAVGGLYRLYNGFRNFFASSPSSEQAGGAHPALGHRVQQYGEQDMEGYSGSPRLRALQDHRHIKPITGEQVEEGMHRASPRLQAPRHQAGHPSVNEHQEYAEQNFDEDKGSEQILHDHHQRKPFFGEEYSAEEYSGNPLPTLHQKYGQQHADGNRGSQHVEALHDHRLSKPSNIEPHRQPADGYNGSPRLRYIHNNHPRPSASEGHQPQMDHHGAQQGYQEPPGVHHSQPAQLPSDGPDTDVYKPGPSLLVRSSHQQVNIDDDGKQHQAHRKYGERGPADNVYHSETGYDSVKPYMMPSEPVFEGVKEYRASPRMIKVQKEEFDWPGNNAVNDNLIHSLPGASLPSEPVPTIKDDNYHKPMPSLTKIMDQTNENSNIHPVDISHGPRPILPTVEPTIEGGDPPASQPQAIRSSGSQTHSDSGHGKVKLQSQTGYVQFRKHIVPATVQPYVKPMLSSEYPTLDKHRPISKEEEYFLRTQELQQRREEYAPPQLQRHHESKQDQPEVHEESHQEYMEPHQEYMEPDQEYMEPHQEYMEPQQEYMEPHREYMEPLKENMKSNQQYMEPHQEYMEPQQEAVHSQHPPPKEDNEHYIQHGVKGPANHIYQAETKTEPSLRHILSSPLKRYPQKVRPATPIYIDSPTLDDNPIRTGYSNPSDGNPIPTDGNHIPTDGNPIPTDGNPIPTDGNPIPTDTPTVNSNPTPTYTQTSTPITSINPTSTNIPTPAATPNPIAGRTPTLGSIFSPTATATPTPSIIPTPTATPNASITPTPTATSTPSALPSATPTPITQQQSNQAKDDLELNEEFALPVHAVENGEPKIKTITEALQDKAIRANNHGLVDHLEHPKSASVSSKDDQTPSIKNPSTPDNGIERETINQDDSALSQDDQEPHHLDPIPDDPDQENSYLYDFEQLKTKSDPRISELERTGPQRVATKISAHAPPTQEGVTQMKRTGPKYVRPSPEHNSKQAKASNPDHGLDLSNTESHTKLSQLDRSGPRRVQPSAPTGSDSSASSPASSASDPVHDLDLSDTESHTRITQLNRSGPRRVQPSLSLDPPSSNPVG